MEPVLVVDDEPQVRTVIGHWVQSFGYQVCEASDAEAALSVMGDSSVSVALCDVRMPGRDGLWLTREIRERHPDTAIVLATGADDGTIAKRGEELGALGCLHKPFNGERLAAVLRRAVDWHYDSVANRSWMVRLREEVGERRHRLESLIGQSSDVSMDDDPRLQELALEAKAVWGGSALDRVIEWRRTADPRGYAASERVMRFAVATAQRLGFDPSELETLRRAAILHDFGKLALPPAVLEKPADFTADERALVRQHPLIAFQILRRDRALRAAADVILAAYESFDGSGYPHGLAGEAIPRASRLLSIVIAYQAMVSRRPHRAAQPSGEAVLELCRCRGRQFDPNLVEAFVRLIAQH